MKSHNFFHTLALKMAYLVCDPFQNLMSSLVPCPLERDRVNPNHKNLMSSHVPFPLERDRVRPNFQTANCSYLAVLVLLLAPLFSMGQDSSMLKNYDNILPRVCIDINAKLGQSKLDLSGFGLNGYGADYIKNNSVLKTGNAVAGQATGFDANIGYFFTRNKRFGLGAGFSYLSQQGIYGIDTFHVEYKKTDPWGDTYRQIITGSSLQDKSHPGKFSESITIQSFSIPIYIKFKHQFSKKLGISADLGGFVNLKNYSTYATNAMFDYEALYAYDKNTKQFVYDTTSNANTYAKNYTWLITKNNVRGNDTLGFFGTKKDEGLNVGTQQQPNQKTGQVTFLTPSYGATVQLNVTYQINYKTTLLLGGFYTANFIANKNNNNAGSWRLTDSLGKYNSLFNGASTGTSTTYGVNIGLRFYIGGAKDIDGDGIADKYDDCPHLAGPGGDYRGCPDMDGDGIPDKDDACPLEKGPACTNGCPDRDNDCIADKVDSCPTEWGYARNHGCYYGPDNHGRYRSRNEEDTAVNKVLPDSSDLAKNRSLDFAKYANLKRTPIATTSETPENNEMSIDNMAIDDDITNDTVSTTVKDTVNTNRQTYSLLKTTRAYFEKGKNHLDKKSYAGFDEAVEILKKEPDYILLVAGFTDDIGSEDFNIMLSYKRAQTIQKYFIAKGIDEHRVVLSGYGKKFPEVPNTTPEARSKNRRIELEIMLPISR